MAKIKKLTDEELIEELKSRISINKKSLEELQELNERLISVNKKLEESEAMKSHFISNITNEIVNPFSSILGLSKGILSVEKENWKKVFSMVALIHSEAFSLDLQLKNIFATAKLEAGESYPEIERVDICSLTRNVVESFRIEAQKKKLSFDMSLNGSPVGKEACYFKTDAEKFKLIFSNLISNAIKFSHKEEVVTIRMWTSESGFSVTVHNHGQEITDEYQQVIFDRFKRVDSSITSINRGHGLGLAIIKSMLDILGGEISFQSNKELGTTFTISVPEAPEDPYSTSSNGNDLFFDDNQVF